MGKQSKAKTGSKIRSNRACGKAPKKNPQPNGKGRTGRTIKGYSIEKWEMREALKKATKSVLDDQA